MSYANRNRRPPRTMLDSELARVLKVTGEHREGFRDHVIISLAVGTALRESEIAGLDLGDVSRDGRQLRESFPLRTYKLSRHRHGIADPEEYDRQVRKRQRVVLPEATFYKLEKYLRSLPLPRNLDRPLFLSERGTRISTRRMRSMWRTWQRRAGIADPYSFHDLRHTAISIYRARTRDIRLTQLFARHARIETTTIYDHPRDQELLEAVRRQPG